MILLKQVCKHFQATRSGGGQNRKGKIASGRPSGIPPSTAIALMQETAPTSYFPPESTTPPNYILSTAAIECAICAGIPDRPLELLCDNIVCVSCCCEWVRNSCGLSCPCCYLPILTPTDNHFKAPGRVTMGVLGNVHVDCEKGCNRSVRVEEYKLHLNSQCKDHFIQSTLSPSRATLRDVITKPPQTPVTRTEMKVAGNVIKRIMVETGSPLIKIPSDGKVRITCM